MAYPDYDDPPPVIRRARARRDAAALALLLAGIGGLIVCAFLWHPLAGYAAISLLTVAVGAWLAYDPFGG